MIMIYSNNVKDSVQFIPTYCCNDNMIDCNRYFKLTIILTHQKKRKKEKKIILRHER